LHYHHAVITADDHESFANGVFAETQLIIDRQLAQFRIDITLVFVRSMLMERQNMKDAVSQQEIAHVMRDGKPRRNDDKFLVFGLVDDKELYLVQVEAGNALMAIEPARRACVRQPGQKFIPVEICQAHAVTAECRSLFDWAASRIKALIEMPSEKARARH
jgi:hypothetical protein